jgi:Family of unknown function (DUF6585)
MQQQQQQRAQQPQQPSLPAEVNILAVQNQLGTWRAEYKARLAILNARMVLVLSLVGILGGAGLVISDYFLHRASTGGALGVILLCGGLWLAINALLYYGLRVYVFTEGLVRVKGNATDVIRWDQIKTIWQKVNKRYLGSFHIGTTHVYTVQRDDGKKFKFNNGLNKVDALGNTLTQEINRRLLPKAIDTYNAGEPVTFGKLSVTIHGISNGEEIILWNQVKNIQVNKGTLAINKDGQWLNWTTIKVSGIPNFPVFMSLVDYIMRST